jgi:hypothetical protein
LKPDIEHGAKGTITAPAEGNRVPERGKPILPRGRLRRRGEDLPAGPARARELLAPGGEER